LSLMRALSVPKRHSILPPAVSRRSCQAEVSAWRVEVAHSLIEVLPTQYAELDLCHVESITVSGV
jgi:hypothetical protein